MQVHPLEIPEVLAIVGSFLHLAPDEPYNLFGVGQRRFEYRTLCRCLRVSKLWYRTLLPVVWLMFAGSTSMKRIPASAISCHSHLIKFLLVFISSERTIDLAPFNCTNLVEAGIVDGGFRPLREYTDPGEASGEQQPSTVSILPGKRLLRSNPRLRKLWWSPTAPSSPALDTEDFVGLKELQILHISHWDCSNGELEGVLRIIAGPLKELTLCWIQGLESRKFTASSHPSPSLQGDGVVEEARSDHGDERLVLAQLEVLDALCLGATHDYLSELVKHCPNLRVFRLNAGSGGGWDMDLLADSLRNNCPGLQSLSISDSKRVQDLVALIRHCSIFGLCTLHVEAYDLEDIVLSAILQHSTTLEDLYLRLRSANWGLTGPSGIKIKATRILRLLVECSKLTRFSLRLTFTLPDRDLVDALREQIWGCRGLRELCLETGYFVRPRRPMIVYRQEMASNLSAKGWERVTAEGKDVNWIDKDKLRRLLELIEFQGLGELRTLVLDKVYFRRMASKQL